MKKFFYNLKLIFVDDLKIFLTVPILLLTFFLKSVFKDESTYSLYFFIGIAITVLLVILLPMVTKFLYQGQRISLSETLIELNKKYVKDTEINKKLKQYIDTNLTVEEIQKAVYEKTISNIENSLISKLDEKYKDAVVANTILNKIETDLGPLKRNTELYIDKLARNSIVNLIIGIIGSAIAISILSYSIISNGGYKDVPSFFILYIPRLTFILFIQIFAFFFLRLYKNNLEDSKYFQNELTNSNSKIAAIKIAYMLKMDQKVEDILDKLSTVERNFKLGDKETLLTIEKSKIEKDVDIETIALFKEFNVFKKNIKGKDGKEIVG